MKRNVVFLLLLCFLLSGCDFFTERMIEPVTFYYLQTEFDYGRNPSVIVSEEREASGHRDDLSYILALYLMGPASDEFKSPLPSGTRIVKPEFHGNTVRLELVNPSYTFSDVELTLACACLTLTCLDITEAEKVVITYLEHTVTMSRDDFTMMDDSSLNTTMEDNQ